MENLGRNQWAALLIEAVGGGIIGALIGVPLSFLLAAIVPASGGGFQDVVAALGGLYLGYLVGVALGVTLIGLLLLKHRGAWWAALVGAIVGAILVIVIGPLALSSLPALLNGAYFAVTALLSAAAFGWSASRAAK